MSLFAISFTIGQEENRQERYDSFVKGVKEIAASPPWEETTSFYLINSELSADHIQALLFITLFSPLYDKMIVINLSENDYDKAGTFKFPIRLRNMMDSR